MPLSVVDLIHWFETWANPAWQESWDNCGWQIEPGVLDQPAQVLVCLTPTLAVMEEALSLRQQGGRCQSYFCPPSLNFLAP